MYTSSDDADDGYYDNYLSRGLCGTGPVNQQDFTIQDAVKNDLFPKYSSDGHCWICRSGCLYVPRSHPEREMIQEELLLFANRGTHPIYTKLLIYELSPMKIHAIKSLSSLDKMLEIGYGKTDLVNDIIELLDQLSMNHLPRNVKMFVKHCDITTHEYNQRTLIGAPDSLWGFDARHFSSMNIDNYQKSEWDNWIACQQKPEPEPAAATYTSLDDEEEGCDDNSISNALYRHVNSRLEKQLQKAVKDWEDCNDYDSLDASEQNVSGPEGSIDSVLATNPPDRLKHKSSKRKEPPLLYSNDNPPLHPRERTTAAADLLLSLIHQVQATSSPPPPTPLSQFNFSYIDVKPPRTTPSPSDDSDIAPSKPISCDKDTTAILSPTSLERTTSYSLLSSHLLVPSQFIKLSYGDEQYCTVLTSKQRPVTLRPVTLLSSIPNPITETFIPSLRAAPSRSVSLDEASNHPYSFLSSVEVGVMIIIIMIILPTILTTILTILPMMLLLLPTVTLTNEELAISPNTKTTITTTVSTTFPSDATSAPTFSHDPGKRKELRLQRQHFWAFIQKLHYSR
eukprot:CAMPEP_0170925016 /NCGR_PEP_ID=MMETSP0735-20130129/12028_1 /TAXON_ID=186038 /ORGANISM="Fragilariopsis kerguelensis, Strain L26-C5" /LENGTH=565 /DNA_ID=CAMNT_0011325007 /DNA_START=152 /DNA_END=1845 /DNA_ORIENTATION=-